MFIRFFYLSNALTFVFVKKFSIRHLSLLMYKVSILGMQRFFIPVISVVGNLVVLTGSVRFDFKIYRK